MSERKYGRLFTEADVLRLIAAARTVGPFLADENVSQWAHDCLAAYDGDFPADEPLFLLRGQDLAAVGAIWGYCSDAQRVGATAEFVTAVMKASNDMADWQRAHRDRLKVPD